MSLRVSVDVGGTFTDLVAFDEATGRFWHVKASTTPRNPVDGVIKALEAAGVGLKEVRVLIHATTLGTNLFFGQAGIEPPKAVLVTNRGFRDILEIGRQNRPVLYDLFFEKPRPLIPRNRRLEVGGRIGPDGRELEPLDEDAVREIARAWCREAGVFVVSFLHSYANPVHERRAREAILEECPGAVVVTSYEVDPQPMEYERTSTAVVNGILKPILSEYLRRLRDAVESRGFRGRILVMQSSGGVSGIEEALERPAAFIESGPAAGAVAVAYFSRLLGVRRALGFDMGGTTAKASSIIDGKPEMASVYEVGGRIHMGRILRGSGYPVRYPYIDLAEVSAGGGTIAWVDPGGALRLGPMSAGADPGPACYGKGGGDATITDANYYLGRLPDVLAEGEIKLDKRLAEEALSRLADKLGMSVEETAWAIIRLANTIMGKALRLVSIERGHDPRDFTLFAFGGAGPLHAVELAEELGVREVVVPVLPGVFSALGLLVTDYIYYLHRPVNRLADELDEEYLNRVFAELEDRAASTLEREGVPRDRIMVSRLVEAKYWGQGYTLTVPYRGSLEQLVRDFHSLHESRYGFSDPGEPVEVVLARVEAVGVTDKPRLRTREARPYKPEPEGLRLVYFEEGWVEARVYRRERLMPGAEVEGPAVIESSDSTILIPPGYRGVVDPYLSIRIPLR